MVVKVFSVYDVGVEAYMNPFFMRSRGEALRAFSNLCNDPQTSMFKNPEDYTLFELASYDDSTGKFTNETTPLSLGVAVEFKKNSPEFYKEKPQNA